MLTGLSPRPPVSPRSETHMDPLCISSLPSHVCELVCRETKQLKAIYTKMCVTLPCECISECIKYVNVCVADFAMP